jgi:DNA polymerase bacteriophage-type
MSVRDFLTRHPTPASPTVERAAPPTSGTLDPDIAHAPEIIVEPADLETAPELQPQISESWCENPQDFFYWDVESRSAATLGKGKSGVGARAYAEHSTTEVLCVAYALGNDPVRIWVPPDPIPDVVLRAAKECDWHAHHAAFDRAMLGAKLAQYGWPLVSPERHICTMILALSHSLPGSLEGAAAALGLEQQKDVAAQRAIKRMFKPRRDEEPNGVYWEDASELRALLYRYTKQDVEVMRELHRRLAPLPDMEREVSVIDAEINDAGVLIDAKLAMAASRLAARALADLDASMENVTKGAVTAASQVARLKTWLVSRGIKLPRKPHKFDRQGGMQWKDSLDGDDIEKLLAEDIPADVREALQIRLQAAQAAVSKIDRMLVTRCADGRVRNMYRMYGGGPVAGRVRAFSRRT